MAAECLLLPVEGPLGSCGCGSKSLLGESDSMYPQCQSVQWVLKDNFLLWGGQSPSFSPWDSHGALLEELPGLLLQGFQLFLLDRCEFLSM